MNQRTQAMHKGSFPKGKLPLYFENLILKPRDEKLYVQTDSNQRLM